MRPREGRERARRGAAVRASGDEEGKDSLPVRGEGYGAVRPEGLTKVCVGVRPGKAACVSIALRWQEEREPL